MSKFTNTQVIIASGVWVVFVICIYFNIYIII